MSNLITQIAAKVIQGELSALAGWRQLKAMERDLESAMSAIKDQAIDELRQYGKEGFASEEGLYTVRSGASQWRYSHLNKHAELKAQLHKLEEQAKAAARVGSSLVDDTGEIIMPAVCVPGADTIFFTANKQTITNG